MGKLNLYIKTILLLCFITFLQYSFGASSGKPSSGDNDNGKAFSLKNLSRTRSSQVYPSLNLSQFRYKGSQDVFQKTTSTTLQGQSIIRLEQGNTTYVYPYNYKVKMPLFKTPSPMPLR